MTLRKRLFLFVPVFIAAVMTLWPTEAAAQRRRGSTRTVIVGARYGYSPFFYPYYYDPFWFGFYNYQYRPYPPYGPYGPYGPYARYDVSADLRIQVNPKQAEVYVDGYLTGRVDDFDGVFQRLRVPPGEHEITIYLSGYRTIREKMLFRPFETYHIKQPMQPLGTGEAADPRPVPTEPPPGDAGVRDRRIPVAREPREPRGADRFGQIAVRVQPADAAVFIDGERWEAPAGENRLLVEISEGTHRVEVRKDGFKTYSSTVRVRGGETVTLNVSLPTQ